MTKSELMARDRVLTDKMTNLEAEIAQLKALVSAQAFNHSPMFSDKASNEEGAVKEEKAKPVAAKELDLDGGDEDCVAVRAPPPPNENLVN